MAYKRGYMAWTGAAITAAALALSPAIGAVGNLMSGQGSAVSLGDGLARIAAFTPTTKDPKLAAAYASAVQSGSRKGFRFTPIGGSISGERSITVLVRAGSDEGIRAQRSLPDLGITPVAFSLNVQHGWRKFAMTETTGRKDVDPLPVENLSATAKGFSLEKPTRFSTNSLTDAKRDSSISAPQMLVPEKNVALDIASSYSLTRNVNVTAGVRYRGQSSRLTPITDERADSQAVYLGTVFKF